MSEASSCPSAVVPPGVAPEVQLLIFSFFGSFFFCIKAKEKKNIRQAASNNKKRTSGRQAAATKKEHPAGRQQQQKKNIRPKDKKRGQLPQAVAPSKLFERIKLFSQFVF